MDKVLIFIGMIMNQEQAAKLTKRMTDFLGEKYLVVIYRRSDPKIEVFYSKDVTHISLDELTEKIKKTLE
jgi:hypothetical protein